MSFATPRYLPGEPGEPNRPLARYLPPLRKGVVTAWLAERLPPGAWVLDPFGASPDLAVEAARAGYRVLVAASNPIARFLLEMAADPPDADALRAALADLAASRKGDERLEPHMLGLYATRCATCGQEVSAEAFLWERKATAPSARIYECPNCGDAGERPTTQADADRAARFAATGMHRARALERVAPLNDPDREHAQEALEVYLPRAVYGLFTLINKLDALGDTDPLHRLLTALLISACDRANTLWQHPVARARPRRLTVPPLFFEYNLWRALEEAVTAWTHPTPPVPLIAWPHPPPERGGISLYEGRLKDLVATLGATPISAVVTALPRPNQAFWTLSALWSAWMWGRDALGPFKSVLRRRRYDWAWHTAALHAAFQHLVADLPLETPVLGLITEAEPGFLSAGLIASDQAGLDLVGVAMRPEEGQAQITWHRSPAQLTPPTPIADLDLHVQEIAQDFLRDLGEPGPYLRPHTAALVGLAHRHAFRTPDTPPADQLTQIQDLFEEVFTFRGGFTRFGGSQHSLDVGTWWLRDPEGADTPLADRVEAALSRRLQGSPGITAAEMDAALCIEFQGLLTPEADLVHAALESYGELIDNGPGWRLRFEEDTERRAADLEEMLGHLAALGDRLGYTSHGENPLLWKGPAGTPGYGFYLLASAQIGDILLQSGQPPERSFIVLPGGRANLVLHKLRCDSRLKAAEEAGWRFLKFRHVRRLTESPLLNQENLDDQLALDPLTYTRPQIPLL